MRSDGFELNDVIGGNIGRLPEVAPPPADCAEDYLQTWGDEPEDMETKESQP